VYNLVQWLHDWSVTCQDVNHFNPKMVQISAL
jgi:hypothetical protein